MFNLVKLLIKSIISRFAILFINVLGILYCIHILMGLTPMLMHYTPDMLEKIVSGPEGIATIFVALGVFYECREDIMEKILKCKLRSYDHYLNVVAFEDGIGLLVIGLFMEIVTISIKTPNDILDTRSVEYVLLVICMILVAISIFIQFDLFKDYFKTYFTKKYNTAHE